MDAARKSDSARKSDQKPEAVIMSHPEPPDLRDLLRGSPIYARNMMSLYQVLKRADAEAKG